MDISCLVAHLDRHAQLRIVHIRHEIFIFVVQIAADFLADLNGIVREFFVGTLRLDLEALHALELIRQILVDGVPNRVDVLFAHGGAADGGDAEYVVDCVHHFVHIDIVCRFDIDGGLHDIDIALADLVQAAAQVGDQPALKAPSVETLEHDLAQL